MTYEPLAGNENITEHVLVCLSPSPTNRKIVGEAAKLAKEIRSKGDLRNG